MRLTKEWRPTPKRGQWIARWKDVRLVCHYDRELRTYSGHATLSLAHGLGGPSRRRLKQAQQDAERLAVEVLLDIRDGAAVLMKRHGIPT
jgi:hypothetical protein